MLTLINKQKNLNIIEIFASVQGETTFSGLPTTFVRLAQCNLRCSWCDTTYSFGRGTPWVMDDIIEEVEKKGCPYVCITGGEPLLQSNVYPLMKQLCDQKFILSLETGGSLSIEQVDPRVHIILDIKCPGSGMSGKNRWENLPLIRKQDEVKFILVNRTDYEYAQRVCEEYQLYERTGQVLFSPAYGLLDPQTLIGWILQDRLPVRLNLQIHKYIWSPITRGV
jgi:7-carboxy-7-deazaguanine synthase